MMYTALTSDPHQTRQTVSYSWKRSMMTIPRVCRLNVRLSARLTYPHISADTFVSPADSVTTFTLGTCAIAFVNFDSVTYDACYYWVVSCAYALQLYRTTYSGV